MLVLRTYQHQAVDHCLKHLQESCLRMYFTLPPGVGKSYVLAALAAHLYPSGRILVLIHRQDIAKQLAKTFALASLQVGLLMQGHYNIEAQVVVATTQSLTTKTLKALILACESPIAAILIDEAHHAIKGSAYDRIITEVEEAFPQQRIPVIGCTATPYRSDKQSMLSLLPTCAFARDIPDMIRAQQLCPLVWKPLRVDMDISNVVIDNQAGESDYAENALATELVRVALIKEVVQLVASLIQQRPTLVFAVSIEHAKKLAEAFRQLGFAAQALSGKQRRAEREQIFANWRRGAIQIVCNCSLLTEGFDFPEISALVIARPTLSPSLYLQMLGRAMRLAFGKKDCLVLDMMGNDPDPGCQVVLPHLVGDIHSEGSHPSSTHTTTTDSLLPIIYGTNTPGLALLDPIGQSHYRWLPYRLKRFEGYLARISQYERAILERDIDGSGLYRSRLYEKQPQQEAKHTWIEHRYLPLRQQVALVHKETTKRYIEALGGRKAAWLHQPASEKQLQILQRMHLKAAQQARTYVWTAEKVSNLIMFLPMRGTLTNPPPLPQEEKKGNVV